MANPNKVFESNINKKDTNYLLYFNLIIAFFGSLFLAWNDVQAGNIYTLMFVGGMAVISLIFLVLRDDNRLRPITDYVKIPFETSLPLAAAFYLVGQLVPIIVKIILALVKSGIDLVSFSVPLYGADIANVQSFSAAELNASPQWKLFNIMFVSGNTETFIFSFVAVLAGVLLGIFTLKLINDGKDLGFISKRAFVLTLAFSFAVAGFMFAHFLNKNYEGIMFVIAGVFLLVCNLSIYLGGVFLSFWMGYHQTNNLLWLIFDPKHGLGPAGTASAAISLFGVIFLIYEILLIYYVLRHKDQVGKEIKRWFNS